MYMYEDKENQFHRSTFIAAFFSTSTRITENSLMYFPLCQYIV